MTLSFFNILNLFSAISFIGFGLACLRTEAMQMEFERYGLSRYRKITGWLQLAGATGLLLGPYVLWLGMAAALGLSLQMLAGLAVRIRIRDTPVQCLPAIFYCALNAILTWLYIATS